MVFVCQPYTLQHYVRPTSTSRNIYNAVTQISANYPVAFVTFFHSIFD